MREQRSWRKSMGRNEQKKECKHGGAFAFTYKLVGRYLLINTLYLFTS